MAELNQAKLKSMPIGAESWTDLKAKFFVDKTEKILNLITNQNKVCFFRPRRFGKTILASTIADLFLNGDKNFEGTAIQGKWPYSANEFKVLNITFYGLGTNNTTGKQNIFDQNMMERNICTRVQLAQTISDPESEVPFNDAFSFDQLFTSIARWAAKSKLVLLIDEWDYPLSSNLDNEVNFHLALDVIGSFFSFVRAIQPNFLLVTGIMRYSNASLLTGNSLFDMSMHPDFADLLGYTQTELENNFGPYIEEAARRLNVTEEALLDKIKSYYDGFCFDDKAQTKLYCPQSINQFFAQLTTGPNSPEFKTFWTDSSNTASALRTYLKGRMIAVSSLERLVDQGTYLSRQALSTASTFEEVQFLPLLAQCGYLTIKEVKHNITAADLDSNKIVSNEPTHAEVDQQNPIVNALSATWEATSSLGNRNDTFYHCTFPNMEVQDGYIDAFFRYLLNETYDGASLWLPHATTQLAIALRDGNIAKTADWLNELLVDSIFYDKKISILESVYRDFIKTFFRFKLRARVEIANSSGRSDLEVAVGKRVYIFELKRSSSKSHKAIQKLLDEAESQIDLNSYGINDVNHEYYRGAELVAVIFVIYDKTRQIAAWRSIDVNGLHQEGTLNHKNHRNTFL